MPCQDGLAKKDVVDVLFKKYSLLKTEIHFQMANYKRHAKTVQLVAAALFGAASYVIVDGKFAPSNTNLPIWSLGLLLAMLLLCYFAYDILDSLYDIQILGERMAIIEQQINQVAEANLLIWETKLSERVHAPGMPFPGVLPPYVMLQTYITLLLVLVLVIFPNAIVYVLWSVDIKSHVLLNRLLIITDSVVSISSALLLIWIAKGLFAKVRPGARKLIRAATTEEWQRDIGLRIRKAD